MSSKKVLSLFSLVMINVVAIDNLRSLPVGAKFGFSLISYYILAALLFFIPVALISAECATGWPHRGGVYIWVRQALGNRWGFFVIWIMWIYNVVWYPSQMIYITGMFWKFVSPSLLDHGGVMYLSTVGLFIVCTIVNRYGMRISGMVSTYGALFGTLLPMLIIICAGAYQLYLGTNINIDISLASALPSRAEQSILPFLVPIIFGLIGIEMSAVHANDVENPQKTYPLAILISTVIIVTTMLLASVSIAILVPKNDLNIVVGIIQVFNYILQGDTLSYFKPILVFLVLLSGISNVATWIIGPSKGMLMAAKDGSIPGWFAITNKHDVPERILWMQCLIVAILSIGVVLLPVDTIFTMLTAITTQLALMMYIVMFISAIILRSRYPDKATYKVPGGMPGLCIISTCGILTSLAIIIMGFFAPGELEVPDEFGYTLVLIIGVILFASVPLFVNQREQNDIRFGDKES